MVNLGLHKPATRWGAFFVHLLISAVIFIVITIVVTAIWFPPPFMPIGGWQGLQIVFLVDMVIGPLLTLIVYDRRKKSLPFDLSAIAALQAGCLLWGMLQVYGERPLLQLLTEENLTVLSLNDFRSQEVSEEALQNLPGPYPKAAYLDLPTNPVEIVQLRLRSVLDGTPALEYAIDRYRPLADIPADRWQWFLAEHKAETTPDCHWVPLTAKHSEQMEACISEQGARQLRPSDTPKGQTAPVASPEQ
jgi:hypothetical protein